MLKINIIQVGKIKEAYLQTGINQFVLKTAPFCRINFITIPLAKIDSSQALDIEKKKILSQMEKSYNVVCALDGVQLNSIQFANFLGNLPNQRAAKINFIIGSSHGLALEIHNQADYKISFSHLTFPYQIFQLLLCEQIYRGFQILNNGKYHK